MWIVKETLSVCPSKEILKEGSVSLLSSKTRVVEKTTLYSLIYLFEYDSHFFAGFPITEFVEHFDTLKSISDLVQLYDTTRLYPRFRRRLLQKIEGCQFSCKFLFAFLLAHENVSDVLVRERFHTEFRRTLENILSEGTILLAILYIIRKEVSNFVDIIPISEFRSLILHFVGAQRVDVTSNDAMLLRDIVKVYIPMSINECQIFDIDAIFKPCNIEIGKILQNISDINLLYSQSFTALRISKLSVPSIEIRLVLRFFAEMNQLISFANKFEILGAILGSDPKTLEFFSELFSAYSYIYLGEQIVALNTNSFSSKKALQIVSLLYISRDPRDLENLRRKLECIGVDLYSLLKTPLSPLCILIVAHLCDKEYKDLETIVENVKALARIPEIQEYALLSVNDVCLNLFVAVQGDATTFLIKADELLFLNFWIQYFGNLGTLDLQPFASALSLKKCSAIACIYPDFQRYIDLDRSNSFSTDSKATQFCLINSIEKALVAISNIVHGSMQKVFATLAWMCIEEITSRNEYEDLEIAYFLQEILSIDDKFSSCLLTQMEKSFGPHTYSRVSFFLNTRLTNTDMQAQKNCKRGSFQWLYMLLESVGLTRRFQNIVKAFELAYSCIDVDLDALIVRSYDPQLFATLGIILLFDNQLSMCPHNKASGIYANMWFCESIIRALLSFNRPFEAFSLLDHLLREHQYCHNLSNLLIECFRRLELHGDANALGKVGDCLFGKLTFNFGTDFDPSGIEKWNLSFPLVRKSDLDLLVSLREKSPHLAKFNIFLKTFARLNSPNDMLNPSIRHRSAYKLIKYGISSGCVDHAIKLHSVLTDSRSLFYCAEAILNEGLGGFADESKRLYLAALRECDTYDQKSKVSLRYFKHLLRRRNFPHSVILESFNLCMEYNPNNSKIHLLYSEYLDEKRNLCENTTDDLHYLILKSYSKTIMVGDTDDLTACIKFFNVLFSREVHVSDIREKIRTLLLCVSRKIPTQKFLPCVSQIGSKLVQKDDFLQTYLEHILERLSADFPHTVIWKVLNFMNSLKPEKRENFRFLSGFLNSSVLKGTFQGYIQIAEFLLQICDLHHGADSVITWKKSLSRKVISLENMNISFPLALSVYRLGGSIFEYDFLVDFDDRIDIIPSLQKPKKITCYTASGNRRILLCKPKEDLRKDLRFLELIHMNRTIFSELFEVKTFAAVPLNESNGLVEWVNSTRSLRSIISTAYKTQNLTISFPDFKELQQKENFSKIFLSTILNKFPPLLYKWFSLSMTSPQNWYNAKINFANTTATYSIAGHLFGLGDRHLENILILEETGSVMHVDFSCIFDKGQRLEIPERVPFRLTQNIVDVFGPFGWKGMYFIRSRDLFDALKLNQRLILGFIEAFVNDPISELKKCGSSFAEPLRVYRKIKDKLRSIEDQNLFKDSSSQVSYLISNATSIDNLSKMFVVKILPEIIIEETLNTLSLMQIFIHELRHVPVIQGYFFFEWSIRSGEKLIQNGSSQTANVQEYKARWDHSINFTSAQNLSVYSLCIEVFSKRDDGTVAFFGDVKVNLGEIQRSNQSAFILGHSKANSSLVICIMSLTCGTSDCFVASGQNLSNEPNSKGKGSLDFASCYSVFEMHMWLTY